MTNDGLLNQLRVGGLVGGKHIARRAKARNTCGDSTILDDVHNTRVVFRNGKIPSMLHMFTVEDVATAPQIKKGALKDPFRRPLHYAAKKGA